MPERTPGEAAVDLWSLVHVASGWFLAAQRMSPGKALAVLAGFEVFEAWLRHQPGGDGRGLTEHESAANIAGDVAFGMLGYYLRR